MLILFYFYISYIHNILLVFLFLTINLIYNKKIILQNEYKKLKIDKKIKINL